MDRYQVVKKIGEGSYGKALLVKRRADGKQCVVKEVNISKARTLRRVCFSHYVLTSSFLHIRCRRKSEMKRKKRFTGVWNVKTALIITHIS